MKKITLLFLFVLTACGTLFSGTTQNVTFNSNVEGATVYLDGMEICKTPCSTDIDRSADALQIIAKKKGYEDKVIMLRSTVNRKAFFNMTTLPSWLTDAVTGGVWEYKNNLVYLQMERKGMSAAEQKRFWDETRMKHFALFNFDELLFEAALAQNGEYTQALVALSGIDDRVLRKMLNKTLDEVEFVNQLASLTF